MTITQSTIQRTLTMMDTGLVTSWLGGQQMRRLDWDLEDTEAMGAMEDMVWEDLVMALDTAGMVILTILPLPMATALDMDTSMAMVTAMVTARGLLPMTLRPRTG